MKILFNMLYLCSFSLYCASATNITTTVESSSAVSLKNDNFKLLQKQANQALAEKNYSGAAEFLEKLLPQSDPKSFFAWQTHEMLGGIYFNAKNYEQAEKHLITFTALCLEQPDALSTIKQRLAGAFSYLGHAQKEQSKYDQAIISYKTALQHEPDLVNDIYIRAGLAICYLATENTKKAQKLLEPIV